MEERRSRPSRRTLAGGVGNVSCIYNADTLSSSVKPETRSSALTIARNFRRGEIRPIHAAVRSRCNRRSDRRNPFSSCTHRARTHDRPIVIITSITGEKYEP